jgi:hypothetical protein
LGRIGHVICGGYEGRLSASLREFCRGFLEILSLIYLVRSPYPVGYV